MAEYPTVPTPSSVVDKAQTAKKAVATAAGFVAAVAASVALVDTSTVQNLVLGVIGVATTVATYYSKNKPV